MSRDDALAAADVALNTVKACARATLGRNRDCDRWLRELDGMIDLGLARDIAGDLAHRFQGGDDAEDQD